MTLLRDWPEDAPPGLDRKVRIALDTQGPVPEFRSLGAAAVRAAFLQTAARTPRVGDAVARVEDFRLSADVRLRVYTPSGTGPFGPVVYFHGGGWVVGDLDTHDDLCRSLCSRANALLVAVEYRCSPETRFPGPLDDAYAATIWTAARAREFNADPSRLAVCGDSAGGALAAGVALRARDEKGPRIALQALVYPVTDPEFETASYSAYASGFGLTRSNMRWFWDSYLGDGVPAPPPAAPLKTGDLRGLPPAFFTLAEFDVLHDEGQAYAKRLREAGVRVRGVRYRGMNHGFLRMGALFPQALRALDDLAAALKQA